MSCHERRERVLAAFIPLSSLSRLPTTDEAFDKSALATKVPVSYVHHFKAFIKTCLPKKLRSHEEES